MASNKFITELGILLTADAKDFEKSMSIMQRKLGALTKKMDKVGSGLSRNVSLPLTALGVVSLKQASNLETLAVSFESMLGSADAASKQVKELVEFTAKTPFQLDGVGKSAKQLLSFGVQQKDLMKTLKTLGDVSAGAGVPLNEMAAIFGKVKAKGKAMTEEILQLSDRGIPIIDVLAKQFGTTKQEVFEMAKTSKISFKDIQQALGSMTNEGGIFANQMEKQSSTLAGLFSTLKDNVLLSLGQLGETISKTFNLKVVIPKAIRFIQDLTEGFKNLSPVAQKSIVIIGAIAATTGPAILAVSQLTKAFGGLAPVILKVTRFLLANPYVLAAAAVAALGVAIYEYSTRLSTAEKAQQSLNKAFADANVQTAVQRKKVADLATTVEDSNAKYDDRLKALNQLKSISPEYFGNLDIEKGKTIDLTNAVDQYSQSLVKASRARILQNMLDEQIERTERLTQELKTGESTWSDYGNAVLKQAVTFGLAGETADDAFKNRISTGLEDAFTQTAVLTDELKKLASEGFVPLGGAADEAINTITDAISTIPQRIKAPDLLSGLGTGPIESSVAGPELETKDSSGVLKQLSDQLAQAELNAIAFGESYDLIGEKQALFKQAIQGLLDEGFPAYSSEVQNLQEQMYGLGEGASILANSFSMMGEEIGNAFGTMAQEAGVSLDTFGKAVFNTVRKVIKMSIAEAVAVLIPKIIGSAPGPVGLALAAAAPGAVSALFDSAIPAFADGGLVYGKTIAQVGEYSGAQSNPEVIAPLDKLKTIIGGSAGNIKLSGQFAIKGRDLAYVLADQQQYQNFSG